jgi:predicted amidohydrolase YtcJ
VTTAADLAANYLGRPEVAAAVAAVTADPSFAVRLAVAPQPRNYTGADAVGALQELRAHSNAKLSFPVVKVVLDGSIQGWTAMISAPGYYTGEDHGEFLYPPEQLPDLLRPFHRAGVTIHCHCNGDLTADVFLDAVETLLREHPWPDHRHTVQHAQLMRPAQLRRAKALGMSVNFFANHIWFWGDQHHDLTVGPERARRMNPCGTAARLGVPFSIHSDAGVTPIGQLHTMWCAVNRVTVSGRVLGEDERITPAEALEAVTLGAARQLRMENLVGSIEAGKYADFAVLTDDPLAVDPMAIRDIGVWGTVLGGVLQASSRPMVS